MPAFGAGCAGVDRNRWESPDRESFLSRSAVLVSTVARVAGNRAEKGNSNGGRGKLRKVSRKKRIHAIKNEAQYTENTASASDRHIF